MSLQGRLALAAGVFAAAGCAAPQTRFDAHLASADASVRECAAWYRALDARVDAAGARDTLAARIPGFPYLRVDPALAAVRVRAGRSPRALHAFVERAAALDLASRRHELANLPRGTLEIEAALRRTSYCGKRLREADLADAEARRLLVAAAALPPAGSCSPGACRAERREGGARVRYAPPAGATISRATVAGILARADFDPLGLIELSPGEVLLIGAVYAPSLEVAIGGDGDRFGRLRWRPRAAAPEVDAAEPSVYVRASAAPYGERLLLQLVYTVWFPERPLVWRVTLAPDGEPLLYDSLDGCGCTREFFPTPRARPRASQARRTLPRVAEGERPLVSVASGAHAIERVELVRGSDSLVRYALRLHDELRSLERVDGTRRAALRRVRLEDPGLVERRFRLDLAERRP